MFEDVAFRREFTAAVPMVIEKWTGPLRIALEGSQAHRYRDDVQAVARLLVGLTRLDIAAARPGETANVRLIFATLDETEAIAGPHIPDKKELEQVLLTSGCLFFYDADTTHRIVRATIVIRVGRSANDIQACLLEEMVQILGLPNDSDLVQPSIFNQADSLIALTALDESFVRILYDPALRAGASREDALAVAGKVLSVR
jgi:hypothetical protein